MIDLSKLGKPETAVAAFVTLLADLTALDEDKMACYLDCYYQLRCTAEKAAALEPVVLQIRPTAEPEDLREAASAFAAEPSPAGDLIRACADPVPGPVDQEPEPPKEERLPDGFQPYAPKMTGKKAALFKRDVRDLLMELREKKMSYDSIARMTKGWLSTEDVLAIAECRKVPFQKYVALNEAIVNYVLDQ